LYLIKKFQRLKDEERKQLGWDIKRSLAKINDIKISANYGIIKQNKGY
jgi:hypothetical protein